MARAVRPISARGRPGSIDSAIGDARAATEHTVLGRAGGGGEAVFTAALSDFRGHFGEQLYSVTALPFHGLSIGAQTRIARAVPQFDGKVNDMRRVQVLAPAAVMFFAAFEG